MRTPSLVFEALGNFYRCQSQEFFKDIRLTFSKSATIRFSVVILDPVKNSSIFEFKKIFFSFFVSSSCCLLNCGRSFSVLTQSTSLRQLEGRFVLVLSLYGPAHSSLDRAERTKTVAGLAALLSRRNKIEGTPILKLAMVNK